MRKTKNAKLTQTLFTLAGILFLLTALIGHNMVYLPLGCCFIVLGIVFGAKNKAAEKNKEDDTAK